MKAILLMLGALSAAIIFVGCGTAVGRATGVESSKSKIAISDSSLPKASGISEDKVRRIVQEELKKYDAVKSKSGGNLEDLVAEEVGNFEEDFENLIQELRTQLDDLNELEPVLENAANIESFVDTLEDDFTRLRRNADFMDNYIDEILESYEDETEEYLDNLNEDSRTQILEDYEDSRDQLQEDYADMEQDIASRLFHISASLARLDSTQMPVGLGSVQRCLSDVECFGMLEQVRESNDGFQYIPSEEEIIWHNSITLPWDVHALPESHKESFLALRASTNFPGKDYCYRSLECSIPLGKVIASQIELAHTIDRINQSSPDHHERLQNLAREINGAITENANILRALGYYFIIPDWEDAYLSELLDDPENEWLNN